MGSGRAMAATTISGLRRPPVEALLLVLLMVLAAGLLGSTGALAQSRPGGPAPLDDAALLAQHRLGPGDLGYILFDPADGRVLESYRADRALIPASVTKIPTTVAALGILGPDYRFETGLHATGGVEGGRLLGDLYLRGGGDPVLTSEHLLDLVQRLRALGVTRLSGSFLYDPSLLQSFSRIDPIQPETALYNPGVSALSLNHNIIQLRWRRGRGGVLETTVTSTTDTLAMPVDAVSFGPLTGNAGGLLFAMSEPSPQGERWLLSPRLPAEGETALPVRDAARNAAMLFRRLCERNGIVLPEPRLGTVPGDAVLIGRHLSAPLRDLVRGVLRYSNNLSAELVGLVASRRLAGRPLSLDQSSAVLTGWLRERAPEVDWTGYAADNHSGLSSAGRASPAQMMAILRLARQQEYTDRDYRSLLPSISVAAGDPPPGAQHRRGRPPAAPAIALRAKTGTLSYARGLAGFLTADSGRELGFAVFVSDIARRQALDAAAEGRSPMPPAAARTWLGRARAVEQTLIRRWAAGH